MKKRSAALFLTIALLFLSNPFSGSAFDLFSSEVKKAKEFMAAGMYPQAKALLEKRITDKPTDDEAHYQLGICHINTTNFSGADERFASAVKLSPDYGHKIGAEYQSAGNDALRRGRTDSAKELYRKAVEYQPNLRSQIGQEAFNQGQAAFDQGNYDTADRAFSVAVAFDSPLSQKVSDLFFNLGNTAEGSQCLSYYQTAKKYSNAHDKEISERLIALAQEKKISKDEVAKYLSQSEMEQAFPPDYIIYPRGIHSINIKAGERTEKRFNFPNGTYQTIESKGYKFKFIYPNGKILNAWELSRMPNEDGYWLEAVTNQNLILKVH